MKSNRRCRRRSPLCVLLLAFTALSFPALALSTVNLPLSCAAALAPDGKCLEVAYQYIPGRPGLRIATPFGVWTLWEELSDTSSVRVCPADIPSGTLCPVARITVLKTQANSESPTAHPVRISWLPPTKTVDETALPAGEIIGYSLSWKVPPTSVATEIKLGNVTEYLFRAPAAEICFAVAAEGKSAFSDASPWVCVTPGQKKIVPMPPSEVRIILE